MAKTTLGGKQITDGTVQRADLDTTTVGQAVIAKVIQGTGISVSSTGGDAGTGDVTVSTSSAVPLTGTITDGDTIQLNNTSYVTCPVIIEPQGRLTLTSATPITNSDVSFSTLYYALYQGDSISLYDGTRWKCQRFTQQQIASSIAQTGTSTNLSKVITGLPDTSQFIRGQRVTGTGIGASAVISTIDSATQVTLSVNSTSSASNSFTFQLPVSTNYDIFYVQSSGKLQFSNSWTNDNTRADLLTLQNGVYVNANAINSTDSNTIAAKKGLYLGTIRTNGSGTFTDSAAQRYVWNNYNRQRRTLYLAGSGTWTYALNAWRNANASATNRVETVVGLTEAAISLKLAVEFSPVGAGVGVFESAISNNSTPTPLAGQLGKRAFCNSSSTATVLWATYDGIALIGYYFWQWIETSTSAINTNIYGTDTDGQNGILGWIEG